MARFTNLSDDALKKAADQTPTVDSRFLTATQDGLGVGQYDIQNSTQLHVSLVCLQDSFRRLETASEALYRGYARYYWHLNESDDDERSKEFWATYNVKFYTDYVFLILYAIGEDLAEFLLHFLEIEKAFEKWIGTDLTRRLLELKRVTSLQAKIGIFLIREFPNDVATVQIKRLVDSFDWTRAISYRNTWVHDKPPITGVFGIEYSRENRITQGDGFRSYPIGSGNTPTTSAEELLEIAKSALTLCSDVQSRLLELLINKRIEIGEEINFDTGSISVKIGA